MIEVALPAGFMPALIITIWFEVAAGHLLCGRLTFFVGDIYFTLVLICKL